MLLAKHYVGVSRLNIVRIGRDEFGLTLVLLTNVGNIDRQHEVVDILSTLLLLTNIGNINRQHKVVDILSTLLLFRLVIGKDSDGENKVVNVLATLGLVNFNMQFEATDIVRYLPVRFLLFEIRSCTNRL